MADLIERLRNPTTTYAPGDGTYGHDEIDEGDARASMQEAADEIAELRGMVVRGNAALNSLEDEVKRLRTGIQNYLNGDYEPRIIGKINKCPHGRYGYEDCENCTAEHFEVLLAHGQSASKEG